MLETYRDVFRRSSKLAVGASWTWPATSVLAVFEAATEALKAAFEIQDELAKRNDMLPEPRWMRFRIGIDLGEIIERPDGTVYGDG